MCGSGGGGGVRESQGGELEVENSFGDGRFRRNMQIMHVDLSFICASD